MANQVVILGVGDVGPIHEPIARYSELAKPVLAAGDIRFAQVERVYSERGSLQVHAGDAHSRVAPGMASIFADCGFDVVSVASNHAMDWGPEALLDSISVLRGIGLKTIGAGQNLAEARTPAIVEKNGVRIAFLAYCSVLREGYAATPNRPGVAPLRVNTYYLPSEYQPGMPPRVVTVPDENDIAALVDDIAQAKKTADIVILSLHWGLHFIPRLIADYQPKVASTAFAAGADLILGHHAHIPKAIAVYDGKVCFYSLSNFVMSARAFTAAKTKDFQTKYGVELDPAYPYLPYGKDAKRSMIAKAIAGKEGIERVSFLPAMIDTDLRPEVLKRCDSRFDEAVRFMEWVSEGFPHRFSTVGDEVVVED
jgi:hypothetical protein